MSMLVAHMNKMKMPNLDGLQMHVERKIQDIAEGLVKNTNITTIKPFSSNKGPRR